MKYPFLASYLLLAGCSTAPELMPQQAAVAAFVRTSLPDSASYEPVRWGKMTPFRASEAAAFDLPEASSRYVAAVTALNHDSAGYVLLSTNAREFHVADQDVANIKHMYQAALTSRDSARSRLHYLLRAKDDTTRLGYRLTHVFRAKTEAGKLMLDSAGFLVNPHGVVIANVPARHFLFISGSSNRDRFLEVAPPPPPRMAPSTPAALKAYLKEPMQR